MSSEVSVQGTGRDANLPEAALSCTDIHTVDRGRARRGKSDWPLVDSYPNYPSTKHPEEQVENLRGAWSKTD